MTVPMVLLAGCDALSKIDPDVEWRHGPYALTAIDTETQMELSMDTDDPGPTVLPDRIRLVGPTVFAVGINDHYVVVKQHPSADGLRFNRAVTNYYVVDRATESAKRKWRKPQVIGPLSKAEFDRLARIQPMPAFSKTFTRLDWHRTGD